MSSTEKAREDVSQILWYRVPTDNKTHIPKPEGRVETWVAKERLCKRSIPEMSLVCALQKCIVNKSIILDNLWTIEGKITRGKVYMHINCEQVSKTDSDIWILLDGSEKSMRITWNNVLSPYIPVQTPKQLLVNEVD